jgi:hypothetical protein
MGVERLETLKTSGDANTQARRTWKEFTALGGRVLAWGAPFKPAAALIYQHTVAYCRPSPGVPPEQACLFTAQATDCRATPQDGVFISCRSELGKLIEPPLGLEIDRVLLSEVFATGLDSERSAGGRGRGRPYQRLNYLQQNSTRRGTRTQTLAVEGEGRVTGTEGCGIQASDPVDDALHFLSRPPGSALR